MHLQAICELTCPRFSFHSLSHTATPNFDGRTASGAGGKLQIENAEGRQIYPVVGIEDFSKYDIRVSVTGGNGYKRAFLVRRYMEHVIHDNPVIEGY